VQQTKLHQYTERANIPVEKLVHSKLNVRQFHEEDKIEILANRINRIGFEETRAVWVTPNSKRL